VEVLRVEAPQPQAPPPGEPRHGEPAPACVRHGLHQPLPERMPVECADEADEDEGIEVSLR